MQAHFDRILHASRGQSAHLSLVARSYRSLLARYYNLLISPTARVLEIGCGSGELLARLTTRSVVGIDISPDEIKRAQASVPHGQFYVQAGEELYLNETFDFIILSDTLNEVFDVQMLLSRLSRVCSPESRLILNFHSNLWRPVFSAAERLRFRHSSQESSWFSTNDVRNLLSLSDWEIIKSDHRVLIPFECLGLGAWINRWIAPVIPLFCLTIFVVARPRAVGVKSECSVSIVIPARNEAGNIMAAVERTPKLGRWTELIFVEGHSRDNTWDEIKNAQAAFPQRQIKILQQTGKGKGNAVREGFALAEGEVLMILDADLTMPPEELPKFYTAVVSGQTEFANGCRLVYPMEGRAMQFLNLCANKAFGLIFTWLLGQHVKDTLCGTKVLTRSHYEKIVANRAYFGDFDPFGDFDLLFGAAKLNLKISDIPIRYRNRTYGSTNIHRWRHGWLLARMVVFAARKLKFV